MHYNNCTIIAFYIIIYSGYFQSVCMKTKEDVERVCDQLESLCEEYNWMSDVWEFIRSWEGSRKEYDMEANEFEVR